MNGQPVDKNTIAEILKFLPIDDKMVEAIAKYKETGDKSLLVQQIVEKTSFDIETIEAVTNGFKNKSLVKLYLNIAGMSDDITKAIHVVGLEKIGAKYAHFYLHPSVSATDKKAILKNMETWSKKLSADDKDKIAIVQSYFKKRVKEKIANDIYKDRFEINDANIAVLIEFVESDASNVEVDGIDGVILGSKLVELTERALMTYKIEPESKYMTIKDKMRTAHRFFYRLIEKVTTQKDLESYTNIAMMMLPKSIGDTRVSTEELSRGAEILGFIKGVFEKHPELQLEDRAIEMIFGDVDAFITWYEQKASPSSRHKPSEMFASGINQLMKTEWFYETKIADALKKHYFESLKNDIKALEKLTAAEGLTNEIVLKEWMGSYNGSDSLYKRLGLAEKEVVKLICPDAKKKEYTNNGELHEYYATAMFFKKEYLEVFKIVAETEINRLWVFPFSHNENVRDMFSSFKLIEVPHYSTYSPNRYNFIDLVFKINSAMGIAMMLCEDEMYEYVKKHVSAKGRENIINRYLEINLIKSFSAEPLVANQFNALSVKEESRKMVDKYRTESEKNAERWIKLASETTKLEMCKIAVLNGKTSGCVWDKMISPSIEDKIREILGNSKALIRYGIVTSKGIRSWTAFNSIMKYRGTSVVALIEILEELKSLYLGTKTNESQKTEFLSGFVDGFLEQTVSVFLGVLKEDEYEICMKYYLEAQKSRVAFVEGVLAKAFKLNRDFYEYAKQTPFYSATSTDKKRIVKKCESLEAAERIASGNLINNKHKITPTEIKEAKEFLEDFLLSGF